MSFFLGIGGPWIVLMLLDLFWTKQSQELSQAHRSGETQRRLESLLQKRMGRPIPVRARAPQPQTRNGESGLSEPDSYLYRRVD